VAYYSASRRDDLIYFPELDPRVKKLEGDIATLQAMRDDIVARHTKFRREEEKARFVAAGGCMTCGGRGWVVTWDTLDCLSGGYAEYGVCTATGCTPEARSKSGLDNSYRDKYDRQRGVAPVPDYAAEIASVTHDFDVQLSNLTADLDDLRRALDPTRKGLLVRVVRGRKVPVGTEGRVMWAGVPKNSRFAEHRLGLSQNDGQVIWVATRNCLAVV
jgi:hypothetical protein